MLAIAPAKEDECRRTIKKICDAFAISKIAEEVNDQASKIVTDEEILNREISNKTQWVISRVALLLN